MDIFSLNIYALAVVQLVCLLPRYNSPTERLLHRDMQEQQSSVTGYSTYRNDSRSPAGTAAAAL